MGIYINKGNGGFRRYANDDYVDKTELIAYVNSSISTASMLTCVSRPRRFGKSMAAQMLYAYYDKSCDSRELFSKYKISQDKSFEQHLNKYPTISIDVTRFITRFTGREDIVEILQREIMKDVSLAYPNVKLEEGYDLMEYLLKISIATGEKFVMIIDEWDALCREAADKPKLMNAYINFLRTLFKTNDTAIVFACVYMTGILPIKKYGTQSALNDFREFSMTSPDMLTGYIGFVAEEVRMLCDKYGMDYDEMKGWYDGYSFGQDYPSLFNPNSVMEACKRRVFANYWAKTEAFESLQQYIDLNMTGIKETLEGIMLGKRQKVRTLRFGFDVKTIGSDEELMTLLIHLGYLSYNFDDMTVNLPNKEIRMEFVEALRGSKTHKELSALIKSSDRLVEATMNKDERLVAEIIEQLHTSTAGPDYYNNEQALRSVLKIGYLSAIDDFVSIQELPTGRGYADLALIPRRGSRRPAVVIELKWNHPVDAAIDQIRRQQYPELLTHFTSNLLLVGITYDEKTKEHSCKILEHQVTTCQR